MNIPNTLTCLRVLLVPIFIIVFFLPYKWSYFASSIIFMIASATDWLDGYLARRLNQSTLFGAFLDPVADKLMVAVALVLLVQAHGSVLLAIPAVIIIGREIIISALREWMAELGESAKVAVSYLGKVKTAAQMAAIILLLADYPESGIELKMAGYTLLYLAAVLTLWSMYIYLKAAWPMLNKSMKN